jgi:hypothetical protein
MTKRQPPTDLLFDAGDDQKLSYPQSPIRSLKLATIDDEDHETVHLTKYKHEYVDELLRMASSGYSARAFCAHINVTYATFRNWVLHIPEFREAAKLAEMKRHLFYEHTGIKNLGNKSFNSALFDRLAKSIAKWKDEQEVIHTHQVKPPEAMSARERRERIEELQKQLAQESVN